MSGVSSEYGETSSEEDSDQLSLKKRKVSSDDDYELPGPSTSKAKKPSLKKQTAKKEPKEKKPRKLATPKPKKEPVKPKKEPAVRPKKEPAVKPKKAHVKLNKEPVAKMNNATEQLEAKDLPDGDVEMSRPFPGMQWSTPAYLAELQQVPTAAAEGLVRLLAEDNTIPFIARYRTQQVGGLGPEKLREMADTLETLERVAAKARLVRNDILKQGKLTSDLEMIVCHARSIDELEYIFQPFKPGSKGTLASRARALGLEEFALAVLGSGCLPHPVAGLVTVGLEGRATEQQALAGVQHIIADVISKEPAVLDRLRAVKQRARITMMVVKARRVGKPEEGSKAERKPGGKKDKEAQEMQFERYMNFSLDVRRLRPHQVLAINRGEGLKVLSVKLVVEERVRAELWNACLARWGRGLVAGTQAAEIVETAFADAYQRLLSPLLVRQARSELNATAARASIDVFASNLKDLLLAAPTRGCPILGLDPGFRNGCKVGVISATGAPLHTDVVYPHGRDTADAAARTLRMLLMRYECSLIAIGNGSACRETETFVGGLIKRRWFAPLEVRYTIVSEQGVSIYSCSPLATREFPSMPPTVVSAISLARRIQDPLSELVKVEPQHLGVGMYQHDLPQKQLATSLAQVVEECVSFVGVDLNAASETVLKFVAGLNANKVSKIVEWRTNNGPFVNREQLKLVAGIGDKCFQQCAGFVRIIPETSVNFAEMKREPYMEVKHEPTYGSGLVEVKHEPVETPAAEERKRGTKRKRPAKEAAPEPLDRTWIHPESYAVARTFIARCGADVADVGSPRLIDRVRNTVKETGLPALAEMLGVDVAALSLMSAGLQQAPGEDLRSASGKPLFRSAAASFNDLFIGQILTGRAENVTHFGVFVDVGVGKAGLLHESAIPSGQQLRVGDRLEVRVVKIGTRDMRLNLSLVRKL